MANPFLIYIIIDSESAEKKSNLFVKYKVFINIRLHKDKGMTEITKIFGGNGATAYVSVSTIFYS